ncbi:hypothetical protein GCM10017774_69040 [Lentzea cavernae]|uniref:Uncharacterized protein n=1 Tax=Lentzea cavernae TaxID=2020703 RepID=A0ABQ3MPV0_9PSEU|nr:hypothetical protein GCM10017774_69040 [Lentzea cavernae]
METLAIDRELDTSVRHLYARTERDRASLSVTSAYRGIRMTHRDQESFPGHDLRYPPPADVESVAIPLVTAITPTPIAIRGTALERRPRPLWPAPQRCKRSRSVLVTVRAISV